MGPHTFNFAEAAQLSEGAGAALRVATLEEGVQQALALATSERREAMAGAALRFAASHRGAADKTATAVLALAAGRLSVPAAAG